MSTYNEGEQAIGLGEIDLEGADIRGVLVGAGYVFDPAHVYADVVAEIADPAAITPTIPGRSVIGRTWSGSPVIIGSLTGATPTGVVLVAWAPVEVDRVLITYLDGGQPYDAPDGTDYAVNFGDLIVRA